MAKRKSSVELPPVSFTPGGDTDEIQNGNLESAQESPGFGDATILVADALNRRVENVMLDYTREGVAVRYQIDGTWHNLPTRDRESGDEMLVALKCLANLKPQERRARQEGTFKVRYLKHGGKCTLLSQGVKTGERVVLKALGDSSPLNTLEEIGMRDAMCTRLRELVNAKSGLILVAAMPKSGFSTAWTACLNATDRFTRDFAMVQPASSDEPEIINTRVATYDAEAGQSPAAVIRSVLLQEPEVIIMSELKDAETARICCEQAVDEQRLVFTRMHAKWADEALLRFLMLKPPPDKFAQGISAVLNARLVRRLCEKCKQGYEPSPNMLQKLGIPQGRVEQFYRAWQPEKQEDGKRDPEDVCQLCHGLGYRGRIGVFELLVVDDRLRPLLAKRPKLEVLRQATKKLGHYSLQDEAILLVCQGITSLDEVQRVLKQ